MTKDEARQRAVELANATGKPHGIWIVGQGRYTVEEYKSDYVQVFDEVVTPAQAQIEEEEQDG